MLLEVKNNWTYTSIPLYVIIVCKCLKEKYLMPQNWICDCWPPKLCYWLYNVLYLIFSEALKYYGNRLTEYERIEVEEYPEIWYLGLDACKIHADPQNGGFDDDNGSYNKVNNVQKTWQYIQG